MIKLVAPPIKPTKGFTIVELLVVIVIIAILAALTTIVYNGIQNRAATATLQSDLRNATTQLGMKRAEDGNYPDTTSSLKKSEGTTYQYTATGSDYCLTATSSRSGVSAYHVSNGGSIVQGACSGHSAGGEVALSCPSGFIVVPGNSAFGTSDFCVMKYEAKNAGSNTPASTPDGTPWVSISQTNATTYSANVAGCSGCHLIIEAEWMTIAANVLSVSSNWSGGSVGSGYIYSGHNDNSPANSLAAADDSDGYNGTGNTSGNQRRTLTLTNGEVIWDFAGNVSEWTGGTMSGNQPGLATDNANGTIFSWKQWNDSGMNWNNLPAGSRPSALATVSGLANINSWTTSNGIGQLYSNQNQTGVRAFSRGGYWNSGSRAGVLTLDLNGAPGGTYASIGFRVAR